MSGWVIAVLCGYLFIPAYAWAWTENYVQNRTGPISPFVYGELSRDFDFDARAERLCLWRRRAAVCALCFGAMAALLTWIIR